MNKINKKQLIKSLISIFSICLINFPIFVGLNINYKNLFTISSSLLSSNHLALAQTQCQIVCSSGAASCPPGCKLNCAPGVMAGCPFGNPVCYNPPPSMLTTATCSSTSTSSGCAFCSSGLPKCCASLQFTCPTSGYIPTRINGTDPKCFRSSDNMILSGTCGASSGGVSSGGASSGGASSGGASSSGCSLFCSNGKPTCCSGSTFICSAGYNPVCKNVTGNILPLCDNGKSLNSGTCVTLVSSSPEGIAGKPPRSCTQNSDCTLLTDILRCLDGVCIEGHCIQRYTCNPGEQCRRGTCVSTEAPGEPVSASSSSGIITPPIPTPVKPEPILTIEIVPIATFTYLPTIFNPFALNIPTITKAINAHPSLAEKDLEILVNRSLKKEKERFTTSLIVGGKAFIGIKLSPDATLENSELGSLTYAIITKHNKQTIGITPKIISYEPRTKELLLEVQLPEDILPGEATLVINKTIKGKQKAISRADLILTPSIITKHPKTKRLVGIPEVFSTSVIDLFPDNNKQIKEYRIVIRGQNFATYRVLVNGKIIKSPIVHQPLSLITFADKDGITIQRFSISKKGNKLNVRILYDDSLVKDSKDIRHFTLSTLYGQTTGIVDLKLTQTEFPQKTNEKSNPIEPTPPPTQIETPSPTPSSISPSTIIPSNIQLPLQVTDGRPPEFGGTRPQAFGDSSLKKEGVTQPPSSTLPPLELPKPSRTFKALKELTLPPSLNKLRLPEIEPAPIEKTKFNLEASIEENIKSLNLKQQEDQIIISPNIPYIVLDTQQKTISDQILTKTVHTRGAIKAGSGGHLIYLKQGVILKPKDLKNILHIVIDNENRQTIIPSTSFIVGKNKILAVLSFPDTLKSGEVTLLTLLNKETGKKEILAKGKIKILDFLDFENVDQEGVLKSDLPIVNAIQGRTSGNSTKGGKILRLTFIGNNFASRSIKIRGKLFLSEPYKTHTFVSFGNESDIEILRTRVLNKGTKMLVTLRFTGDDIVSRSLTISTPKGQTFYEKAQIKLSSK